MVQFMMDYLSKELPDDTRTVFELPRQRVPGLRDVSGHVPETVVLCRESFKVREQEVPAEVPEDLVQAILAAQKKHSGPALSLSRVRPDRVTLRSRPR